MMQAPTVALHFRVKGSGVQATRLKTVWQLAPDAILYAAMNGEGIPLTEAKESPDFPGTAQWTWTFPGASDRTSRTLNFEIHTPAPGCRLLHLTLE